MSNTPLLHLEQFRQRKGVSLEQIAQTTKIGTNFLRLIESEEFDKLPGGVFNINYLRQYALAVGYDAEDLLQHYYDLQADKAARETEQEERAASSRGWSVRSAIDWLRSPSPATRY